MGQTGGAHGKPPSYGFMGGKGMEPKWHRKKLSKYHPEWSVTPERPDKHHANGRLNKFRDLPVVTKPVWSFDIAESAMILAAAVADNVVLWDLLHDPPEIKVSLNEHKAHVWCVRFSPNETTLATASSDKTVRTWVTETGHPLMLLEAHTEGVRCLAFSLEGILLSGGMDSQICMWEHTDSSPVAQWWAHEGHVHALAFPKHMIGNARFAPPKESESGAIVKRGTLDDDAERIAISVGADGYVAAWYATPGHYQSLGRFAGGEGGGVLCVVQHSTEPYWCACGNESGAVYCWRFNPPAVSEDHLAASDVTDVVGHVKLLGHKQSVRTLAFTQDGVIMASGSSDGIIRLWDVRKMHLKDHVVISLGIFKAHDSWVTELRFEMGNRGLVTSSSDGLVTLWNAPDRLKKLHKTEFSVGAQPLPKTLEVVEQERLQEILKELNKNDPAIDMILADSKFAVVYMLHVADSAKTGERMRLGWQRQNKEGPVYIVRRKGTPRYQLIVDNPFSTGTTGWGWGGDDLVDDLHARWELDSCKNYIFYKREDRSMQARGLWFKDDQERERIEGVLKRTMQELRKGKIMPAQPVQDGHAAAPASADVSIMQWREEVLEEGEEEDEEQDWDEVKNLWFAAGTGGGTGPGSGEDLMARKASQMATTVTSGDEEPEQSLRRTASSGSDEADSEDGENVPWSQTPQPPEFGPGGLPAPPTSSAETMLRQANFQIVKAQRRHVPPRALIGKVAAGSAGWGGEVPGKEGATTNMALQDASGAPGLPALPNLPAQYAH